LGKWMELEQAIAKRHDEMNKGVQGMLKQMEERGPLTGRERAQRRQMELGQAPEGFPDPMKQRPQQAPLTEAEIKCLPQNVQGPIRNGAPLSPQDIANIRGKINANRLNQAYPGTDGLFRRLRGWRGGPGSPGA